MIDAELFPYTDDEIVIYNKAAGQPSHPLSDTEIGTALHTVASYYPEVINNYDNFDGGLCHRLDNSTSGLLVFARSKIDKENYLRLFQSDKIFKGYIALVEGHLTKEITIEKEIAHHKTNNKKMG